MFDGRVVGIIATSALEVGIDLADIAMTIHCGYPGTFQSLLQQSGSK